VQVSADERYIYTGKDQLRVLELRNGRYTLLKAGSHISNFIDIKLLNDGSLLVFDEQNSNLEKYNKQLKLMSRLEGRSHINIGKFSL
jgi:hypothetical protein